MPKFKTRSDRNFSYGRQLQFAGLNALRTNMPGQFQTVADHADRWKQFCLWAKAMNIKEAHHINNKVLQLYANYLRSRLEGQGQPLAVATAQNRLSTCNVVLKCLRGNRDIRIHPAEALDARRKTVRTHQPELSRDALIKVQDGLLAQGQTHIALILGLCREFGLRVREAALLDSWKALDQATEGVINIERGTKGGRSKSTTTSPSSVKRLVPVTPYGIDALEKAAKLQGKKDNLVAEGQRLVDFMALIRKHSRPFLRQHGFLNRHELRAAYACERYQKITGKPAPIITGGRRASKEDDLKAREMITTELGHSRPDVLAAYVGSPKTKPHQKAEIEDLVCSGDLLCPQTHH